MALPALSVNLTVRTRAEPAVKSDCRLVVVAVPDANVTELSVLDTDAVIVGLNDAPSMSSSAVPPADPTSPAVIVAPTLNAALVAFKEFATTVPPLDVKVSTVGAVGADVSNVKLTADDVVWLPVVSVAIART
jgi:hypothetical protein